MLNKIKVLGYGGAFDAVEGNSSFLIDNCILFDCGSTTFNRLTDKQKSSIKVIVISHLHDDHIGSLSTLIYYRWFMLGKATTILTSKGQDRLLDEYLTGMVGHKDEHFYIVTHDHYSVVTDSSRYTLTTINTIDKHVKGMRSCGLLLVSDEGTLIISGDIAEPIINCCNPIRDKNTIVLHDVSLSNSPDNVHCYYEKLLYMKEGCNLFGYHASHKALTHIRASIEPVYGIN